MGEATCSGQTRIRLVKYGESHTLTCQQPEGHDGAHEWRREGRTVSWYGPARPVEDNTRYRFGLALEAK